ncbi:MlaD family protein [Mycobacterium sp. pUA109]|uniref:MlaD family protein n=1 Tax=Mycobacterium sp. pUA109 TaxID=3238982 RepID=UPI00351B6E8C
MGVTVLIAATSCTAGGSAADSYCALLPDAVGLYVDNPVTQMGYQIGKVKKVTPGATNVQVDFSVSDTRPLPNDVKAVIRSTSVLADRALELVGNYEFGPKLEPGQCIPLDRSVTPKSISQVVESANNFVQGINPEESTNIGDALREIDQATQNTGPAVNQILTTAARLLDNPDQSISDLRSIVGNVAQLSTTLVQIRDPLKLALNDAVITSPYVRDITEGGEKFLGPLRYLLPAVVDIATHTYDETQLTLDAVSDPLRINTPHMAGWVSALGGVLQPLPWWINTAANHINSRGFSMSYRPPLYRIRTPDGAVMCNVMNVAAPGSCANVSGQPYAADIDLLQYVFMSARR